MSHCLDSCQQHRHMHTSAECDRLVPPCDDLTRSTHLCCPIQLLLFSLVHFYFSPGFPRSYLGAMLIGCLQLVQCLFSVTVLIVIGSYLEMLIMQHVPSTWQKPAWCILTIGSELQAPLLTVVDQIPPDGVPLCACHTLLHLLQSCQSASTDWGMS